MDQIRRSNSQAQTLAPSSWRNVRIGAEDDASGPQFGIISGPAHWSLHATLTTEGGIPAGKSLMLRAVNTKGDADNVVNGHPIVQFGPTDTGPQHFGYSMQGWTDEGQTLRVQANADAEVTLTKTETRASIW